MVATLVLAVLGVLLIVAGTAFIYWPAALIVAGIGLVSLALLVDPETFGRSRK